MINDNANMFNNFLLESLKLNVVQNLNTDTNNSIIELKTKTERIEVFFPNGYANNPNAHANSSTGGHSNASTHTQNGKAGGTHYNHNEAPFSQGGCHTDQYTQNHGNSGHGNNHGNNHGNHAQNTPPDVTVSNKDEIINFTYSKTGRTNTDGTTFNQYGTSLYSDLYASNQNKYNGVFVVVNVTDVNTTDYLKGVADLKDKIGNTLASSDILWSDVATSAGTTIVQSNATQKKGYIFFSKDLLPNNAKIDDAIIHIEVKDYSDAACTQLRSTTVRETVSAADSTMLYVDIVTEKPTGSIKINKTNK